MAEIARSSGAPVLVVFTAADCGYCARLKSEVLEPLREAATNDGAPLVREYRTNTQGKVLDFDGSRTRARTFLRRYDVFAVPTAVLLDANGRRLGEPIVGFDNAENYRRLLEAELEMARGMLRNATPVHAYAATR